MKIAVVFDGLGFGGIERIGVNYINIMEKLGHKVDVFNLNPYCYDMEKELENKNKIIHYKFPHKFCPELYSYGVKKWWWGKYAYPIIYIILAFILKIKKNIMRISNEKYDLAIAFSGHFNDLTFVAKDMISAEKKMCWLHGSLAEYLLISHGFGTLYKDIRNLNTLSDWMQESAIFGNKFLSKLNINKIYNPIFINNKDIDKEIVEELKRKYGDYFLMVGRFTKQKDQKTVVKAMKILKDKFKIENKLIFVGDGEEREKVEEMVVQLGLENDIIFMKSRRDVQNFYYTANLFIHSSPAEGLPTVLLEAMSFGVPIVATNSLPGVKEILCENEYGLICEVGNEIDMAEKIIKMVKDSNLYDYYSKQGYKRIRDFQSEIIGEELKEILNNLI